MEGIIKKDKIYCEFLNIGSELLGFNLTEKLLACPFYEICHLPKHSDTCRNPECKECSDYKVRIRKLKSRILY